MAIAICGLLLLSRIVCRGQEGPTRKGSKGTLKHDFQANIWTRLFYASVTTRNRKTVVRKSRYS
jgi:hypothetical protein